LPRACRIARHAAHGFGVEFLDPIRHEVEEILNEIAFKEELLFEALSPALNGEATMTTVRLHRTVKAIMELIGQRNAMNLESPGSQTVSLRPVHEERHGSTEALSEGPSIRLLGVA